MSRDNNVKTRDKDIGHDQWFRGRVDEFEPGKFTYFICEYYKESYRNPETGEFYPVCIKKNLRFDDGPLCSMDCEEYGRCSNCRGFSAVRCDECTIPRMKPKE